MKLAVKPHPYANGRCLNKRGGGKFLRHWVVLFLLILASCAAPGPQQVGTPTLAPSPSPLVTVTPSPIATHRPTSTSRPTITPTPTARFPLTYEATPTVTPAPEAVAAHARELACNPPCWFGLEPGVNTLQDVLDLWGRWSEVSWEWDSKTRQYGGYLTNAAFYIGFEADRQGTLTYMEVEPFGLAEYSPSRYLPPFGKPLWMAINVIWSYPCQAEAWYTNSFFSENVYLGYPQQYIALRLLIGNTQDLGLQLPHHLWACVPQPYYYATYFAFPKEQFSSAWVWQIQDEADPPAHFLTSKEEIWEQIIAEQTPFCIEMELETP